MQIKNDISLDIATGLSRTAKVWKNAPIMWSALLDSLANTTRTHETMAEYKAMTPAQQSERKDVGGFVGGYLTNGRRTEVKYRSVLCLDADFAKSSLWDDFELLYGNAGAAYSTHKHTPEKPRLRLVIPLARNVDLDEYQAIGRKIANDLGIDQFDDTSYQPERLMYWPSTSEDGEFYFRHCDGPILEPDEVLATYVDWRDISAWPFSSRVDKARRKKMDAKQADPLSKPGVIGAFCRAYTIEEAIEAFIPAYQPCGDGRYTYTEGSTAAGVVTYDGKFSFSHHGTDPASGQLCNAWDLVRIHLFHDMDADVGPEEKNRPSSKAMTEFATKDTKTKTQIVADRVGDDFNDDYAEPENTEAPASDPGDSSWMKNIKVNGNGGIAATINNVVLILENDPELKGCIAYDELTANLVLVRDLPWRKVKDPDFWPRSEADLEGKWDQKARASRVWSDVDDSQLRNWLQKKYDLTGKEMVYDAVNIVADTHSFHPVREYLSRCTWDGTPRVDTFLIDYMGAEDNEYTRAVTRKTLVAAVARVVRPGIKFDYMLTLKGAQGIGKSSIFRKLAGKWYSDTVNSFSGKESYEQARGIWIGEAGELSGLKKSEVNDIKAYLSRQVDRYRPAYGRRVNEFPRQCIFVGTTNEAEFLRDATGNRRWWVVDTPNKPRLDQWEDLTPEIVMQIWGEAVELYKKGETLRLSPRLEAMAQQVQASYEEENPRVGMVLDYLERKLPADWADKTLNDRRYWLETAGDTGTEERVTVCTLEIWAEALNQNPDRLDRLATQEVRNIMLKIPGWKHQGNLKVMKKPYGRQRYYLKDGAVL